MRVDSVNRATRLLEEAPDPTLLSVPESLVGISCSCWAIEGVWGIVSTVR